MGQPSDTEPHSHANGEDHCHLSAKYTEYIKIHLHDLQSKCNDLTICINKLLSQQNPIAVLQGDNLGLDKICELIDIKGNGTAPMLDGKCSYHVRNDIRVDVENHIKDKMEKRGSWDEVAVCLENNYGDNERTTYVSDICGIVERNDGIVCRYGIGKQVERFINEQIEHLQCTCKALQTSNTEDHDHGLSTAVMAGIGAGALVLLFILFGLVFYCWRRKRRNRKKKKVPNVIYLPAANSENYPVYQEIFDQRSPPSNPPTLPSRYGSRPLPGHPIDDVEYLEPVQAQAASGSYRSKAPTQLRGVVNNPGYNVNVDAPPEYSETDQMYEDAVLMTPEEVNVYIDPIVTPKENKSGGYDSLDIRDDDNQADDYNLPDEYQPLEDVDRNKKLGPDPADRTKKDDRETESEYFELEKDSTTV